jgi:MSHA pilin protein MshA
MIELIVVIVILGILAAMALPRFLDLRLDAQVATLSRMAGALSSASGMNYGRCQITGNVPTTGKCEVVSNCTDVANLMLGGLPSTLQGAGNTTLYIESQVISSTTSGVTAACSLRLDDATTSAQITSVHFQGISAGL